MTPSSEEKEMSALFDLFPSLQMDQKRREEIARHLQREKESLASRKRRKTRGKLLGGLVFSLALMIVMYQIAPPSLIPSNPGLQTSVSNTNAGRIEDNTDTALTIESQIQSYVEQALDKTEAAYAPERMTAIVTNPATGEILGLATRSKDDTDDGLAGAVRAIPNPGAAFQMVTLAAAIEEGKFDPRETYDSGTYNKIPGTSIPDYNNGIGWGKIPFLEGVQRSSNVAFAILGYERVQQDLLLDYFERFGFGQKTGIDIGEEESGQIPDMDEPREVALAAMGEGGSATAIQQAAAVGAIANGGELLKPHMRRGAEQETSHEYKVGRVISEETAKQVREIMESIVSSQFGSGRGFFINNYRVAGKSSVSQKLDQKGRVMDGKYLVSFIGFAPSENPRLLMYIVVDEPKTELPASLGWKEIVALPFKEVMEKSLPYMEH